MARRQRASIDGSDTETEAQRRAADENKGQAGSGPSVESIAGEVPPSESPYDPAKAYKPAPKIVRDRGL